MSKKTRKRFLSLLLGLAMVLGTVSLPGTAATVKAAEYGLNNPVRNSDNTVTTWDCVWFGSYPQTEIVGEASQSGVYQKDFVREGDYIVNASLYNKLSKSSSWNANNELLINGVKYKRVQSSDACYVNENIAVSYANFDWNNSYHYFRYDPIKWRVLEVKDGIALLLADKVLDCKRFNEQETEVLWEDSTLRSWLSGYSSGDNTDGIDYKNNNFYDAAFSVEEKKAISNSYRLIDSSAFEFTYAVDKVSVLSKNEVCNKAYGFSSDEDAKDGGRKSMATAYSRAMGIRSYQTTDCYWWTNSSGKRKIFAEIVSSQGDIYNPTLVVTSCEGVRPELYLKLSSSEWSPAGKVCSDKSEREQYPESYYDVEFRAAGAENFPADMTVVENQTVDIPVQYPQKFGANFKNWEYVYRTGIPPIIYYYQPGDLEKVTRNMILTAQWDDPIAVDNTFPKNYETSIRGAGEHVWYEFIPRISGVYDFTSSLSPDVDAMVTLYSEDGTVLRRDDDSGEGRAFKISEFLIEGKKYYFETSLKNSSAAGDFTITVDKSPELILPAVENKELYIDAKETFSAKTSGASMYRWDVIDDKYNHYSWDEVARHATLIGRETSTLTIIPKDLWLDGKWLICYVGNSDFGDDTKPIQLSVDINPFQTGKAGDNATWTLNTKTGELKISGTGKLYDNSADEHWNNLDNFASLIKTVTIDEGITGGAIGTFSYLSSVTSIKLPNTYETISGAEFMFCRSLEEIWLPAGIKCIAGGSFYGDKNLKTIHFGGSEYMWKLVEMDRQDKYNAEFLNAEVICQSNISILTQPTDITVTAGETAAFSVKASGEGLKYQWKKSTDGGKTWVNSSSTGATTDTLTMATKASFNGYQFRCEVTDKNGITTTSAAATLTVKAGLAITTQPSNVTVAAGETATFKITATGDGLKYQWKKSTDGGKNWVNSSSTGATTATLTMTTKVSFNGYKFKCVVTDKNGKSVESNAATLTVTATDTLAITSQPSDVVVAAGDTATFKIAATGEGLKYQWKKSTDGGNNWANSSSTGATTDTLTMTTKASYNGLLFKCVVTDKNGKSIESSAAVLTVTSGGMTPMSLAVQPKNESVASGSSVTFTVKAIGEGLTYQWKKSTDGGKTWVNSSSTGAKTNTLTMATKASYNGLQFKCVVTDKNGKTVTSNPVTLTVVAAGTLAITTQPSNVTVTAGATATFKIAATGTGLKYQWKKSTDGGKTWVNSASTGATTNTLSMTTKASYNGLQFKCVVTDANGKTVTSNAARLTAK